MCQATQAVERRVTLSMPVLGPILPIPYQPAYPFKAARLKPVIIPFENPKTYRTEEEEAHWRNRDPLVLFRTRVLEESTLQREELDEIDRWAEQLIRDAIAFADESPLPGEEEVYTDVYVDYPMDGLRRGASMGI